MPRTVVAESRTQRVEVLSGDGTVDEALMPAVGPEDLRKLYRDMVLMRRYDEKAVSLQRQGLMGTWASLRGQEGAQAGVALAMTPEDWLVPSFREHEVERLVEGYVAEVRSVPPQSPGDIFDHMYADPPWFIREQRRELLEEVGA